MESVKQLKELASILDTWTKEVKGEVDNHAYSLGKNDFRYISDSGNMKYKQSYLIPAPNDVVAIAANHATLHDVLSLVKEMIVDEKATPTLDLDLDSDKPNSSQALLDLNFDKTLHNRLRNN